MVATTDAYGAPRYGPIGRPPAGIVFHTPENADASLASAIALARWQATPGNTRGGSYHGILGHDAGRGPMSDPAAWVMVRSVPWDQACGGLSTRRDAVWAPGRFPWIAAGMPPAAYADPNRWMHQIALSGKAAYYVTNGYPRGAVIAAAEWVKLLEDAYRYDAVLTLHRMWQTNKRDPGPIDFADLVLAAYHELKAPAPTPAPAPPPPADPRLASKDELIGDAIAVLEAARRI